MEENEEDLLATSEYYNNLKQNKLPHQQALQIAKDKFNKELTDSELNKIMQRYACSLLTIEQCVFIK